MELTFDQDNLRGCVQIGVVDDGIIEGMEVFNVVLTSDNETTLSPDTAIIQIVERESKTRELVLTTAILVTFSIALMLNGMCLLHS